MRAAIANSEAVRRRLRQRLHPAMANVSAAPPASHGQRAAGLAGGKGADAAGRCGNAAGRRSITGDHVGEGDGALPRCGMGAGAARPALTGIDAARGRGGAAVVPGAGIATGTGVTIGAGDGTGLGSVAGSRKRSGSTPGMGCCVGTGVGTGVG